MHPYMVLSCHPFPPASLLGRGLTGCFVKILPPYLLFNDVIAFYMKPSVSPGISAWHSHGEPSRQPAVLGVALPCRPPPGIHKLIRRAFHTGSNAKPGELEGYLQPTLLTMPRKEAQLLYTPSATKSQHKCLRVGRRA